MNEGVIHSPAGHPVGYKRQRPRGVRVKWAVGERVAGGEECGVLEVAAVSGGEERQGTGPEWASPTRGASAPLQLS